MTARRWLVTIVGFGLAVIGTVADSPWVTGAGFGMCVAYLILTPRPGRNAELDGG